MIRTLAVITAISAAALSGCGQNKNRVTYEGQSFNAKLSKVDKQRDVFVVSVKDPARSMDGARQAAHHAATSYCVETYGTSDIIWDINPLDEEVQLRVTDNQLSFRGRCPQAQRT